MSRRLARFLNTLALIVSATACTPFSEPQTKHHEFLTLSREDQERTISESPADLQIDLWLAAMDQEPPDFKLADVVARSGERLVPVVTTRVRGDIAESEKASLVYLLSRVSKLGYYPVASDEPAMAVLRAQVGAMKDPLWKREAEADLSIIERESADR